MNLKLEIEFSKAGLLQEVDALKKQIDDMRPLPEDVEGRVMQKLRLDWNYHSNAIEGNRLSYGETVAFLMEEIMAKGKPLKDHLDIRGHNKAINFLLSVVKDSRPISETDIRNLHEIILVEPYDTRATTPEGIKTTKRITLGEYKTSSNHVKTATGEIHYYATPEETPAKMQELMEWYREISKSSEIHPIIIAALFHHKFVAIHPFDDGNGRLSRILMNLILMQNGYPPVVIKMDDRQNYYSLLSRADHGDIWPFIEYIVDSVRPSLQLYLKAAKGGDINEDDDIDKEIALFRNELQSNILNKKEISSKGIYAISVEEILPLIKDILEKSRGFNDLFFNKKNLLEVTYTDLIQNVKEVYATVIGKADIGQFFNFFLNETYRIESISLDVELLKFKDIKNIFDVTGTLSIFFTDYEYRITNHNHELYLVKSNSEKLSESEKKHIISTILRDIKNLITENIK